MDAPVTTERQGKLSASGRERKAPGESLEGTSEGSLPPLSSNKNFRLLFTADILSGFGDRLSVFALFILIFQMTGRALDMGLLMIIQAVPAIIIGPPAGVFVDRADKKRILIVTNLIQGFLIFLIPFTWTVWQVYLIAAAQALTRQIFNPARLALLPEVVDKGDIPRANALASVMMNVLMMAGPAAGGVIVGFFGTSPAFFIDAATFALGAGILAGIVTKKVGLGRDASKGFAKEFKEGISFLIGHPLMRRLVPFLALLVFVGSMQSPLIVVFVKKVLSRGDVELGILLSALGAGGILGGVVTAALGSRANRAAAISWLFIAEGLLLALFALNRNYAFGVAIFVCFGTLGSTLQIILMSLFQTHVPEEKRGRVFANLAPVLGPLSIISIGIGTSLADIVGVMYVLLVSGIAEFLCGVYGSLRKISVVLPQSTGSGTPRENHPASK
ncbi:MAG: MFS transporter [Candidatus Latescibacteria bacterium]|nr:MFS transporter [Candidatus Latescibacterota bacterium]NIM22673.1 MFS transporter [Candidatus Latescibacterota bacterium]NIM64962.1 MFS transporter [Candidatus Latescibacterota bacterium]NIO01477.1 MFS transporter [Candidatus Latescibacterota bacterium]NIO27987.1 MFS transporter [Candidatus Latescibacterota bacterium]